VDYSWWRELNWKGITFVSRVKKNQAIFVSGQHKKARLEQGILKDEEVYLDLFVAKYPNRLRRVTYYDKEKGKIYEYLTNDFNLGSKTIADIYKDRWQIELFFKWIKQNLKIKTFLGTSKNAVMTQIWIAMIYYLLLAYIKFQTKFDKSLLELTRMFREALMFRRNLIDLLSLNSKSVNKLEKNLHYQMSFW
jgi:IS4 transposase